MPDQEEMLNRVLPILQGLLASGHYTIPANPEDVQDEPRLFRIDQGKDWKEDGYVRRFHALAISDALELESELYKQIEADLAEKAAKET